MMQKSKKLFSLAFFGWMKLIMR